MEFVEIIFQLAPVPYLDFSFTVFKGLWDALKDVQSSKQQFNVLAQSVAQLLHILDKGFRSGSIMMDDLSSDALIDLERLLKDISAYIQKQSNFGFVKLLLLKEERLATIEAFNRRIYNNINAFQVAAMIDIRVWQTRNEEARRNDQGSLHARLRHLEANQRLLIEALDIPHSGPQAIMATLRRRVDERKGSDEELRFLKHSLSYLSTTSNHQIDLQPWTITSYDVEFGPLIGVGGFGRVYRGKWNHTDVALKVMRNAGDISPRASAVRRETWSKLRHPNILQFLGANILDDEPFLVMPLVEGGNARDYIDNHPHCNRIKIVQQISLGLTYLHSQSVVHGDLKAVNVLIDDAERALLCDFGLARLRADVNSRTADSIPLQGSQNWMAPELFEGRSLRMPCDIYSFGMTLYEIYTGEIPFGHLSPQLIPKLVAKRRIRPERPEHEEAPYLSDDIWNVAQHCWSHSPADRPLAITLSETLTVLLHTTRNRPQVSVPHPQDKVLEHTGNIVMTNGTYSTSNNGYTSLVSPLTTLYSIPDSPFGTNQIIPDTPPRSMHGLPQRLNDDYEAIHEHPPPAFPVPNVHQNPPPAFPTPGLPNSQGTYETMFRFESFALSLPPVERIKIIPNKRLVLAFDIGISYSSISYSIIEDNQMSEIKGVTIISDRDQLSGSFKVPTTIYYDEFGELRAIGAETMSEEVIKVAESNGWRKVKWFKLHLWPHIIPGKKHTNTTLPSNKRPEDILSDYLQYLYRCSITYIKKTHINWQELSPLFSSRDDIDFVLTYPNGWDGVQEKMTQSAVLAGLVSDDEAGRSHLSFVTEGEANLSFVLGHSAQDTFQNDVAVIVDAGDYMVTISSYVRNPSNVTPSFEEITQPLRHLSGSIFVTSLAKTFFQRTLSDSKFKDRADIVLQSFERTTKFRFSNPGEPEYLTIGGAKDNDKKRHIKRGQLRLQGADVASFFEPSIKCIVDSVKEQRKTSREKATHVILVGELSASEWLFSRVTAAFSPLGYSVIRPDYYM
uniref:Protein kinase domain-containing protein n=1 Tax=Psilocybe cubensis TaxID=181762 RepID=A0A8H7Y9N2_PSICU